MCDSKTLARMPTKYSRSFTLFFLIGFSSIAWCASEQIPVEKDQRVQAQGGRWSYQQAPHLDPKLPRVLLVGDSILIGYRNMVIRSLEGKACVDTWTNPYYQSEGYNRRLAEVLTHGPFTVIHINTGLHGFQEGRIPFGAYEPLTQSLLDVILRNYPDVKIIWANTTPVISKDIPRTLDNSINPIIVEHNRMAANVMVRNHVSVNDFYSLLTEHMDLSKGDQFHWTEPAYRILANTATASIVKKLESTEEGKSR
jgi:hypothetical protein